LLPLTSASPLTVRRVWLSVSIDGIAGVVFGLYLSRSIDEVDDLDIDICISVNFFQINENFPKGDNG
jgi:hypothetical protein